VDDVGVGSADEELAKGKFNSSNTTSREIYTRLVGI
jgi:hypothetical protein